MYLTESFLDMVKAPPTDMTRTTFTKRKYLHEYQVETYYDVVMTWKVGKITITIKLRDEGTFSEKKVASLALISLTTSKKKFYNLFTDTNTFNHTEFSDKSVSMLYEAIRDHYFNHNEDDWVPRDGKSINEFI